MDLDSRGAIVLVGILFVFLFGGSALAVIGEDGIDVLTVVSLLIAALIMFGVIAVIRNPPKD
ncbi:MAG: hypothetical protein QOJ01_865 [Solirubrobacterales bacterium]|jgi:hypothetical protein|nr:hypothetical protein [Solirubrobacterales bacterium]